MTGKVPVKGNSVDSHVGPQLSGRNFLVITA